MLKNLSYSNIAFALIYYLSYLINSNSFAAIGILFVVAFNGFVLRNIERDLKFGLLHYILAGLNLVFAGFLITWTINITLSSIDHDYFIDSWVYITFSSFFIISMVWQFILFLMNTISSKSFGRSS